LILKPVGNGKLSKRDGDKLVPVFPLEWKTKKEFHQVTEKRIFPEAVVNFLALLVGTMEQTKKYIL
jgi:glutamyl-tRNA synthetase